MAPRSAMCAHSICVALILFSTTVPAAAISSHHPISSGFARSRALDASLWPPPQVIQLRRPCCGAAGGRIKHHIGLGVVRLGNQAEDVESGVSRGPGGRPPGARRWAQGRIRDELTRLRGGSMPSDVSMQLQDLMEQLTSAADKVLGPGSGNSSVTEARPQ